MCEVDIVVSFGGIDPELVVEEHAFAFQKGFGVEQVHFQALALFKSIFFVFKVGRRGKTSIFAVKEVLARKMKISDVSFIGCTVAAGKTEIARAR